MVNVTFSLGRKNQRLNAILHGVSGFTGRGSIAFHAWRSGAKKLNVRLRGVAGKSAEIFLNGQKFTQFALKDGNCDFSMITSCGGDIPDLVDGANVEIRQNDQAILSGALTTGKPALLDLPRAVFYNFHQQ